MRKIVLALFGICYLSYAGDEFGVFKNKEESTQYNQNKIEEKNYTTTEYLDQAQNSLKTAQELGCELKASYECARAESYYKIAKEEASMLNLEKSKEAALKSIEWSLKAVSKIYEEKEGARQ